MDFALYRVKRGDTLSQVIATHYPTEVRVVGMESMLERIQKDNPEIRDVNRIAIDQLIILRFDQPSVARKPWLTVANARMVALQGEVFHANNLDALPASALGPINQMKKLFNELDPEKRELMLDIAELTFAASENTLDITEKVILSNSVFLKQYHDNYLIWKRQTGFFKNADQYRKAQNVLKATMSRNLRGLSGDLTKGRNPNQLLRIVPGRAKNPEAYLMETWTRMERMANARKVAAFGMRFASLGVVGYKVETARDTCEQGRFMSQADNQAKTIVAASAGMVTTSVVRRIGLTMFAGGPVGIFGGVVLIVTASLAGYAAEEIVENIYDRRGSLIDPGNAARRAAVCEK
jgi:hypothetical protein